MNATVTLTEIASILDAKRIPINARERKLRKGSIPYYGAQGIIDYIDGYLFEGDHVLIAEDGENLRSRKVPIAFRAKDKFWVNNHAHIILGKESWINDYIEAFFYYKDISPYVTGAAQPKLNQENLLKIKIPFEERSAKRIAKVWNILKTKIELNRKMNKTLEEMGQALFKHSFINNKKEKDLQTIPITNLVDVQYGHSFKSENFNENSDGTKIVRIRNILKGDSGSYTTEKVKSRYFVKNGDLLVGMDGEFHIGYWFGGRSYLVQRVARLRAKNGVSNSFIKQALKKPISKLGDRGAKTTVAHLGAKDISEIQIPFTKKAYDEVSFVYDSIFNKQILLNKQILQLNKLRNDLLPRLMAGRIEI